MVRGHGYLLADALPRRLVGPRRGLEGLLEPVAPRAALAAPGVAHVTSPYHTRSKRPRGIRQMIQSTIQVWSLSLAPLTY